jgi:hypothetical protein
MADVKFFVHGLFFMTYNSSTGNLEILAPRIDKHHFVSGPIGLRAEQPDGTVLHFENSGLQGGQPQWPSGAHDIPLDVPGTILQFTQQDANLGGFDMSNPKNFVGKIILPWPLDFTSLRTSDLAASFPFVKGKQPPLGEIIQWRSKAKGSDVAGIVTVLRYSTNGSPPPKMHFYLQPCTDHKPAEVNADLAQAANCFVNRANFNLELQIVNIPSTSRGSDDEKSLEEDFSPDILAICPLQPKGTDIGPAMIQRSSTAGTDRSQPAVSPANCPTFFVG